MSKEEYATHDGVNTLMLYALSPSTTTQFAEVKVCEQRCLGGEALPLIAKYLTRAAALMPALTVLAFSIIDYI